MALKPGTDIDMEHDPQLAAGYRRASGEMPSPELDAHIRAAARREVGAGPRLASRRSAWQVPLSLAAVVVVSVTIVLMMRDEGLDRVEPELPPPVAEAVAPRSTPDLAAAQRMAEAPQPPAVPRASPPAATGALQANPAPAPVDAAPPVMAKAKPAAEAQVPAATAALRDDSLSAAGNAASVRESVRPLLRSTPAGAAAEVAAGPAARASSPPAPDRLWYDLINEPAEKWAQRIVEWRRTARVADADALAAEFRRRFPGQTLPDEAPGR